MTYSIAARDPLTGRYGVAVQSHAYTVGPIVPWLEPGIGAVATQAFVNVSFGPIALEMLRNEWSAERVIAALVAGDETPEQRQIGVVDGAGRAAAYTGAACVKACGHVVGDGFTVQGNLLERDEVWQSMAPAYEAALAAKLPLSERLLRTLEAAEAAGGDVRGRQSAAIVIVDAELRGTRWRGLNMDLRVEDHDQPVPELRRLVNLWEAQALLDDQGDAAKAGQDEVERYQEARRRAPEFWELAFWAAIELAKRGEMEIARREMAAAVAADGRWRTTLEHMVASGRVERELADQLLPG
ncbi:MAG: DUF1028 domain-containing protein [Chloroflexota bacterium]|nr:DUF1028 domain-containing protein [Chloroflexota bacterium]